jgi:hypothetical protein
MVPVDETLPASHISPVAVSVMEELAPVEYGTGSPFCSWNSTPARMAAAGPGEE